MTEQICNKCYSLNVWKCGKTRRKTGWLQVWQCKTCGHKFTTPLEEKKKAKP